MSRLVLLDAGPLGLATNPKESAATLRCVEWLCGLLARGVRVMVPEIAYYEVRRELALHRKVEGIARMDALAAELGFLQVNLEVWARAADLWAMARAGGYPTAADPALDADVILAAQAQLAAEDGHDVCVATDNVGHLTRFVEARRWDDIA